MPARLKPHVLVVLGADLAQLECGAHLAVQLVLLLGHLNVVFGFVGSQGADVGVHHPTVGIQVAASTCQIGVEHNSKHMEKWIYSARTENRYKVNG